MGTDININPSLFPDQDKDRRIISFLKGLPHLDFSERGLFNVCRQFSITPDQMDSYIGKFKGDQEVKGE